MVPRGKRAGQKGLGADLRKEVENCMGRYKDALHADIPGARAALRELAGGAQSVRSRAGQQLRPARADRAVPRNWRNDMASPRGFVHHASGLLIPFRVLKKAT